LRVTQVAEAAGFCSTGCAAGDALGVAGAGVLGAEVAVMAVCVTTAACAAVTFPPTALAAADDGEELVADVAVGAVG